MIILVLITVAAAAPHEFTIGHFASDQAERACTYSDSAKTYVCDPSFLKGAVATRVRFEASASKEVDVAIAPVIEGSEGRCATDPSETCVARVPPSSGCIKGALMAVRAQRSRLKVDWNDATFTVSARAVAAMPTFVRDPTSFSLIRPSVAPPGASIVEEIFQVGASCLLPRVPPDSGDTLVFNVPMAVGGKVVEVSWTLQRQPVPATERELFGALRRPTIDQKLSVDPGPWIEPSNVSKQQRDYLEMRHRTSVEDFAKAKRLLLLQAAYDEKARQLGL